MSTPTFNSTTTVFDLQPTGDVRIDALLSGRRYTDTSFTFSFPDVGSRWAPGYGDGEPFHPAYQGLSPTAQADVRAALAELEKVADIRFTEVVETATVVGDFRFAFSRLEPDTAFMYAYLPSSNPAASDVWLNTLFSSDFEFGLRGSFTYMSLIHEVLHGLGLEHPFEGDITLPIAQETRKNTVMSYNSLPEVGDTFEANRFYNTTPMAYDILALQHLYGANTRHASGDDTYTFRAGTRYFETLYDTGGNDTIRFDDEGTGRATTIDLQGGAWSRLGLPQEYFRVGQSGRVSDPDTVFIFYDTVIENAIGGAGNDTLLGNTADNRFTGGSGSNIIDGRGGTDTALYIQRLETVSLQRAPGGDVLLRHAGGTDTLRSIEVLAFSDGAFLLDDVLAGNAGNLRLSSPLPAGPTRQTQLVLEVAGPVGADVVILRDGAVFASAVELTPGRYRWQSDALPDARYVLTAAVRSGSALSAQSAPLVFVVDATAPEVLAQASGPDTGLSATDGITSARVQTVTLRSEPGLQAVLLTSLGDRLAASESNTEPGFYSVQTPPLPEGRTELTWELTDAVGNRSVGAAFGVTIDLGMPQVTTSIAQSAQLGAYLFGSRLALDAAGLQIGDVLTPAFLPLTSAGKDWQLPKATRVVDVAGDDGLSLLLQRGEGRKAQFSEQAVDPAGAVVGKPRKLALGELLAREAAAGGDFNGDGLVGDAAVRVAGGADAVGLSAWQGVSGGWFVSPGLVTTGERPDTATALFVGSRSWSPGKALIVGVAQPDDALYQLLLQAGKASKPTFSVQGFDVDSGQVIGRAQKVAATQLAELEPLFGIGDSGGAPAEVIRLAGLATATVSGEVALA